MVGKHLTGVLSERYLIAETEFLCLQIRKILENIALMSLVANKEKYAEIREKFSKDWNAKCILQDLKRINPNYYPVPLKAKPNSIKLENGKSIDELINNDNVDEYLTESEFIKIYNKCGGMLHEFNPYSEDKDIKKVYGDISVWIKKIVALLNQHEVQLYDDKYMIVGQLVLNDFNEKPRAYLFEAVDKLKKDDLD